MNRKLIGATTLVSVILALALILAVLMNGFQKHYQAEKAIVEYKSRLSAMDEGVIARHRMLARWYNFCLNTNSPSEDWQDAYQTIWDIYDGMMGYLELPEGNLGIPIYHNASLPNAVFGAGHVPGSEFPVGGIGNHTVLIVPKEAAVLEEGDVFCVHIPGSVIYYTVRDIITVLPGQTDGLFGLKGEELCTLSATVQNGKEIRKIMMQGIRCEEKSKPREKNADEDTIKSVFLWMFFIMTVPLITGTAGWAFRCGRKIYCWRLTKFKG